MAKKPKVAPEPTTVIVEPLALTTADGRPLITVDAEAVAELRGMLTRLLDAGALPRRLTVAAALRREGVTYLASAIGAMIAGDLKRRVGIVELNWHWPSLGMGAAAEPGAPMLPGVADVLAGTATWEETMIATSIEGLSLIPAGSLAIGQRAVVARSTDLREQIIALSERFDHLLIDVPSVLATTDAIPLAATGELCCIVVRQGVTPRRKLMQALDDLKRIPMMGVVMNRVRIATPGWIHRRVPQE